MSGIPVYSSSPINAAKASGITPKTQAGPPASGPMTATTTASPTTPYQPARPGAAAVPVPTGAPSQRYAPVQSTPTKTVRIDSPAPPQPGAVPTPFKTSIPPPPKAGEKHAPPPQAQVVPPPYPPQMAIPPPTQAYGSQAPTSSTRTSTTPSAAYPVALPQSSVRENGPEGGLDHPPGYHQDTFASELTSDQRRAQASSESSLSGGIAESFDTGSAWDTAKQWIGTAGAKLSETEQEIWRKINKE